jgi:hypothetical protein
MVIVPGWEVDRGAGRGIHFNGEAMLESGEEVPSGAGCMLARGLLLDEGFAVIFQIDVKRWETLLVRRGRASKNK